MEKGTPGRRITALDGVRGIAILLVVLTHVNSKFLQPLLSPFWARVFFSSGVTGVSLLFILSGFFMALMYPDPVDRIAFIQKRYTRIFPLFTLMCLLAMLVRTMEWPWYIAGGVGAGLAFLFHYIWAHVVQLYASPRIKRLIFLSFIAVQLAVGSVYFFWVMRQPVIIFNQVWSPLARETLIGLVNGTLTLPLGDYIPMIDGVYWSLAAEVLFYVLYATICTPIINSLVKIPRIQKLFLLLLLIPFFGGLNLLATRLFGLSLLQPEFGYYFVMGIVLGYLYRHKQTAFEKVHRFFPGVLSLAPVLFFFACVFFKDQSFQYVPRSADPWLHILWAIPLTIAIGLALDPKTFFARVLRSRTFVFLGTISYSMYLSHSLIVHIAAELIPIHDVMTSGMALLLSLLGTIGVSLFLYRLLELPYFSSETKKIEDQVARSTWLRNPKVIVIGAYLSIVVSVLFAYQSNFNLFSTTVPVEKMAMLEPLYLLQGKKADMTTSPKVVFEFVSPHDEFGVMTLKLLHVSKEGIPGTKQRLQFSIKESGASDWYARNSYALEEIGATDGDPFGFPVITNASGKRYHVEFELLEPKSQDSALLDLSTVSGVYTVNKKQLIKNPLRLARYTLDRMQTVFKQADAKKVFWYTLPALSFVAAAVLFRSSPRRPVVK